MNKQNQKQGLTKHKSTGQNTDTHKKEQDYFINIKL